MRLREVLQDNNDGTLQKAFRVRFREPSRVHMHDIGAVGEYEINHCLSPKICPNLVKKVQLQLLLSLNT